MTQLTFKESLWLLCGWDEGEGQGKKRGDLLKMKDSRVWTSEVAVKVVRKGWVLEILGVGLN